MSLSAVDLRLLERAAKKTLTAIYPETLEACRKLAEDGYLDTVGWCQYKITSKGQGKLDTPGEHAVGEPQITPRPAASPAPASSVSGPKEMDRSVQRQSWRGRLSHRQREIMGFIESHIKKNGYPPNIREIGEATGISSTSVVNYNLIKLEERGFLERAPRVSRGLKIVDMPGQSRKSKFQVTPRRLTIEIPLGDDPQSVMERLEETTKQLSDFQAQYQQSQMGE